jgi:hypothetical protein
MALAFFALARMLCVMANAHPASRPLFKGPQISTL